MPVERVPISLSQFAELLAIDPARFVGVEFDRRSTSVVLVLEPIDEQRAWTALRADVMSCKAGPPRVEGK